MNLDTNTINRHIFSEGNIQASPAEIQQLNALPPVAFKAGFTSGSLESGYRIYLAGYASKLYENEKKQVSGRLIERTINSLRSNPRPTDGFQKKGTTDTRILDNGFYYLWYKIHSGQILIYNIEPKDNLQLQRDRLEKVGIYKIRKNSQGIWESIGKVNTIDNSHAAVNGQSNNLAKATWLMGAHLDFEFGKGTVNEYTLFHNPSEGGFGDTWESVKDKFGVTTDVTKKFSQLLQDTQQAEHKTKWIAHSQGGLIFAEAVRYYLNGNSSWSLTGGFNGAFHEDKGNLLNMHSVAFHGNANNNLRSKVLFDRAGVNVIATRANTYDFVNTIIGANSVNPWRTIGSAIYSSHVFSGSTQQSPHTLMHDGLKAWNEQMDNGPGKGRGPLQKGFNALDTAGRKGIKYINNYLK